MKVGNIKETYTNSSFAKHEYHICDMKSSLYFMFTILQQKIENCFRLVAAAFCECKLNFFRFCEKGKICGSGLKAKFLLCNHYKNLEPLFMS